jgi:hypothetical protein
LARPNRIAVVLGNPPTLIVGGLLAVEEKLAESKLQRSQSATRSIALVPGLRPIPLPVTSIVGEFLHNL